MIFGPILSILGNTNMMNPHSFWILVLNSTMSVKLHHSNSPIPRSLRLPWHLCRARGTWWSWRTNGAASKARGGKKTRGGSSWKMCHGEHLDDFLRVLGWHHQFIGIYRFFIFLLYPLSAFLLYYVENVEIPMLGSFDYGTRLDFMDSANHKPSKNGDSTNNKAEEARGI